MFVCRTFFSLKCDGTKEHPITLKGPTSGEPAIVKGDEKSGTCVEINHDYWILEVRSLRMEYYCEIVLAQQNVQSVARP